MWTYDYEYGTEDELYHHGILGMRWGIRRYQNADGSLTAAGRKRRTQLEGELSKLPSEKKSEDSTDHATSSTTKPKHKSVNDMSDDELANATRRLQAEKNYLDLQRQVPLSHRSRNPKAESLLKISATPLWTISVKMFQKV